jgi:hypothetical protein
MVHAAMIYRLDLGENDPSVFENQMYGIGKIMSVSNAASCRDFQMQGDGYVIKMQVDTIRGNKMPFSSVLVQVPNVPSSIGRYNVGSVLYFYGALINCRMDSPTVLVHSVNLPQFLNAGSITQAVAKQAAPKFKRRKIVGSMKNTLNPNEPDEFGIVVKTEPIDPAPVQFSRLKKKSTIIIDDDLGQDGTSEMADFIVADDEEEIIDLSEE